MTQTAEEKQALKEAKAAAPDDEALRDIAARVPPLVRDEDHSFVPADDTDVPDLSKEPKEKLVKISRPDNAGSSYERSSAFNEAELERLSDDQLKEVQSKITSAVSLSRLAPSSSRPRSPNAKAPAAGAGSWPVNESQMPAVMPTDPPVEEHDDRHVAGDNGLAKRLGLSQHKDGTLVRNQVRIGKKEVAHAAALYLRLRQQFPAFTEKQLADEFELQWLSERAGAEQSHRAGAESSPHGNVAAGDERVTGIIPQGALRSGASEASPQPSTPAPRATPDAGLPSQNEPSSTAVDDAKKPSGDVAAEDQKAVKQTEQANKKSK